jgi:hypothetical protein
LSSRFCFVAEKGCLLHQVFDQLLLVKENAEKENAEKGQKECKRVKAPDIKNCKIYRCSNVAGGQ